MRRAVYTPAQAVGAILREKGFSLSLAESCTGGLASSAVTDISGSSDYFKGSVIAYSNEIKEKILGVGQDILERYGAVSRQCAMTMACGVMGLFKTDASIAITGIAGPGGGSKRKPVGTVYISVRVKNHTATRKFLFKGTRKSIKKQTVEGALAMLEKALLVKRPEQVEAPGRRS